MSEILFCLEHPNADIKHCFDLTQTVMNGYPSGEGTKSNHDYKCNDCGREILPMVIEMGDILFKKTDYWRIERKITGFNGSGCPWIEESWIWPDGKTCRTQILTLNYEQTLNMLKEFKKYE